jgi:acyl carrier protein
MIERVIQIISETGGIEPLAPDSQIYEAGFSSLRALELLLSLEKEFGIELPDKDFIAARTPAEIAGLIERLQQNQAA